MKNEQLIYKIYDECFDDLSINFLERLKKHTIDLEESELRLNSNIIGYNFVEYTCHHELLERLENNNIKMSEHDSYQLEKKLSNKLKIFLSQLLIQSIDV